MDNITKRVNNFIDNLPQTTKMKFKENGGHYSFIYVTTNELVHYFESLEELTIFLDNIDNTNNMLLKYNNIM